MGTYKLPFPEAKSYRVNQGNNEVTSHHGMARFAFDFALQEGDVIVAARAGIVARVEESHVSCGDSRYADKGNYVLVNHYDDNTADLYLHIAYRSAREFGIAPGVAIRQGQAIARCGQTGWTFCQPQLHFQRQKRGRGWWQQSVPVSFADVSGGIPTTGQWVTSANHLSEQDEPDAPTLLQALQQSTFREVGAAYERDHPMFRYAIAHSLGAPMGPTFRRAIHETTYAIQIFARDTLYTAIAFPEHQTDWEDVRRMGDLLIADQDDALGLALLQATFEAAGHSFQPEWASHQYYLDQLDQRPLGAPLGPPLALEVTGQRYDVEIFALDTLYTQIPFWSDVQRLSNLLTQIRRQEPGQ